EWFLEGRVHRWVGTVNGLPGGRPAREPDSRHLPEPTQHSGLFVVGDYLFDSTLNGVLDSADVVAEWIMEEIEETRLVQANGAAALSHGASSRQPVNGTPYFPADVLVTNGSMNGQSAASGRLPGHEVVQTPLVSV